MTGSGAHIGRVMSQGALTAIDQINEGGGIKGYKFKLIITDFKNVDVNLAVTGVRKMIDIDKVPVMLAAYSPTTLACQPVCAKAHVLMINGGAYSPKLMDKPYLYTIRLAQNQMVPAMLKFLWDKGVRKLGLLYVSDPSAIVPVNDFIKPEWTKWGGKIVADEPHQSGTTDLNASLARIKAGNPDAIVNYSTGESIAYGIKQAREMGMNVPIVISDWMADYQTITGKTSNNTYNCVDFFDAKNPDEYTQRFVKDYEKKFKDPVDFFAANYFDAVMIFGELIQRAAAKGKNPLNGAELEKAIWENPTFKTVYGGELKLKKDGSVAKQMVIFEIVDGKLTIAKKIAGQ
jgi:branched-chain amino acid transport system substrate-binding protein